MKKSFFSITVILVIGLAASGHAGMFDRGPARERSAAKSGTLEKAEQAFLAGDYEEVIALGDSYLSGKNKSADELQYLMGKAFLKLNRFDEARNRFSRVINQSDNGEFLDEAYIGFADSYYLEGDYNTARDNYEKITRYFPDSDAMPVVYYRLGSLNAKLGNAASSKDYYDRLLTLYPDSLEANILGRETADFVPYSVQVGSFESWKNAKALCDELKANGFDANIYAAVVGDSRFYRVRVGNFDRLGDAEDMARALKNKGYSTKICP